MFINSDGEIQRELYYVGIGCSMVQNPPMGALKEKYSGALGLDETSYSDII